MHAAGLINIGTAPENMPLNRYTNIIPYDQTLVSLSNEKFINANHINLGTTNPTIIAQCPMHPEYHGPNTTSEFWRMIYEQRVSTIVNLARVETGFGGASMYWPSNKGDKYFVEGHEVECVDVCVVHEQEEQEEVDSAEEEKEENSGSRAESATSGLTRRLLRLTHTAAKSSASPIDVVHYHFRAWPNYNVASSSSSTVSLLQHVLSDRRREKEEEEEEGVPERRPTLVHCSGGVGRSGTFVAALTAYEQIREERKMDGEGGKDAKVEVEVEGSSIASKLLKIVQAMRQQRHPWMVEGEAQFLFAARLVEELLASGEGGEIF